MRMEYEPHGTVRSNEIFAVPETKAKVMYGDRYRHCWNIRAFSLQKKKGELIVREGHLSFEVSSRLMESSPRANTMPADTDLIEYMNAVFNESPVLLESSFSPSVKLSYESESLWVSGQNDTPFSKQITMFNRLNSLVQECVGSDGTLLKVPDDHLGWVQIVK